MSEAPGITKDRYEELVAPTLRLNPSYHHETLWMAQGTRPSVRDSRTDWHTTELPAQQAPRQRSTKLHGKPGYRTVGATWRRGKVRNPIK